MGDALPAGATKKVFFHVGAPKTGTTYLQQVLFQNREALARDGVLYPYEFFDESFRSMQDFRGASWGRRARATTPGSGRRSPRGPVTGPGRR